MRGINSSVVRWGRESERKERKVERRRMGQPSKELRIRTERETEKIISARDRGRERKMPTVEIALLKHIVTLI